MIYDELILVNNLEEVKKIRDKLRINEKDYKTLVLSKDEMADGLQFEKLVFAPGLEIKTEKQKQTVKKLELIAMSFRGYSLYDELSEALL